MDEFDTDNVKSVEFCISDRENGEHENYLIPADDTVQDALLQMLHDTVAFFDEAADNDALQEFELSEKYSPRETLVADLDSEAMAMPKLLFDEEGWESNPGALADPGNIPFYFAVYRDKKKRKLVGVKRATRFKGVLKSPLVQLFDDSLRMVGDNVFRLDHEFDFLISSERVYILHPLGFDFVAEVEELIAAEAHDKALALGGQVKFADFGRIAEFVKRKKRAARIVASLSARDDLAQIKKSKFIGAAGENGVDLEQVGQKFGPAEGFEFGFLELLDSRRYTTNIKVGAKEKFLANSRKRIA
ncbi:MAG: hypothetical protein ABSD74_19245 [Rhizomicrobium sp.]|jgi:hypothetical protein